MIETEQPKGRILIVEDEFIVAQDIRDILESQEYMVTSIVTSGEDAIERIERDSPDLVLMDINLRGKLDGIETAEHIRRRYGIPVVYLTAYIDEEMQNRAMITDPLGYITKPFQRRELLIIIEIALQQNRIRKTMRQSEEMFRNMIEKNSDGIVIVNLEGKILFVNPSAEAMFGRTATSMIGNQFGFPIVAGEISEVDVIRPGQGILPVEMRIAKTVYNGGRAYLASLRDVSERKRTEAEIMRQRAHITSIFEYSLEGIVTLNREGGIVNANRGFQNLFGYDVEKIRGKKIGDLMLKEIEKQRDTERISEIAMARVFRDYERVRYRADGSRIDVSISGGPIIIEGETEGCFIIYRDISRQKEAERKLKENLESLLDTFESTVQTLATAVEMRDPYTAGHQRRVMRLACAIAEKMNLPKDMVAGIRIAASIHDVGKIQVPAELLSKPTKLSEIEYDFIKTHSQAGYELLKGIDFPWPIADIVHQHHERFDGTGYPNGLKGNNILKEARVIAVADVVEAMASHRPYRPSLGMEKALEEIERGAGRIYDASVVAACIDLFREDGFILEEDRNIKYGENS